MSDLNIKLLALICEVLIPPSDIPDKKCREIFDRISDNHGIESYKTLPQGGILMSSKQEKKNLIKYNIMKDRAVMVYEYCENSMNYFMGLADDFTEIFTGATGIKVSMARNVIVRKLIKIPGIDDLRDFLMKGVYSLTEDNLKKFERPLHLFGTRIVFPQHGNTKNMFDVKIESYLEDHRILFFENKAIFAEPIDLTKDRGVLAKNITDTSDFLDNNITDFITQFI